MQKEGSLRKRRRREVQEVFERLRKDEQGQSALLERNEAEDRLTRSAPQYLPSLIISPTLFTRSRTRRHDWRVSMAESRFSATRRCLSRDFFCRSEVV